VTVLNAIAVAGTEDEVGSLRGFQQSRDIVWIVRKIPIHLEDKFVIALQRPGEPGAISASQPILLCPMQDVDMRMRCGECVGHLAGAVGRIVVHHE